MSRIVIDDLDHSAALDRTASAGIAGGMDVQIHRVDTTIQNADDEGTFAPGVLGLLVGVVLQGLRG